MLIVHALIEFFGFADYAFDKRSGIFKKRYSIGIFTLGDTYRFPLENLKIKASATYSDIDIPVKDLYRIEIIWNNQKIEFYSSKDLELIKKLFAILHTSGIKSLIWEIDETELM